MVAIKKAVLQAICLLGHKLTAAAKKTRVFVAFSNEEVSLPAHWHFGLRVHGTRANRYSGADGRLWLARLLFGRPRWLRPRKRRHLCSGSGPDQHKSFVGQSLWRSSIWIQLRISFAYFDWRGSRHFVPQFLSIGCPSMARNDTAQHPRRTARLHCHAPRPLRLRVRQDATLRDRGICCIQRAFCPHRSGIRQR